MKTDPFRGDWQGQVIDGKYPLLQWLGGSESSGIFLTELEGDQPRRAAIRLVYADSIDADGQIARWASASTLSHPHLMRLFHAGRCQIGPDRLVYAVTEYAEENLSEILPERALTANETREMLDPVLDALGYLHAKGFVHGGLKPSNILVVSDQVKLSCEEIQTTGKLGNPSRALDVHDAPECTAGAISPASDLWSLGVTLVEALTQHAPAWDRAAQKDPVVPGSVPQPFARIARESLHLDPALRCTLDDVKAHLGISGSPAKSADNAIPAVPFKSRRPMILAAAVLVTAIIAFFLLRPAPTAPPPVAEQQAEPAIAKPSPSSPAPERQIAPAPERPITETAPARGETAEQVMPDLLPQAVASIHGQVNVKVRVTVDAAGNVTNASLDSAGPSKYFAKAALQAAQRWRFKPVQVNGQAVPSVWLLQFQFTQAGSRVTPVQVSP